MTKDDIRRMAEEVWDTAHNGYIGPSMEGLERFAALIAAASEAKERETICDEWSMCVQADLEHGVKSLNEQAAKDWFKNYPEISKFWGWLEARGTHEH